MLVNIGGKKIWYEIYGTKYNDTLLYLHGGPGASCLDFVNQAKALSEKIKVVIFDQLGVLRSEAIAENESYSMEYQDVLCKGWSHHLIHMTAVHLWQNDICSCEGGENAKGKRFCNCGQHFAANERKWLWN